MKLRTSRYALTSAAALAVFALAGTGIAQAGPAKPAPAGHGSTSNSIGASTTVVTSATITLPAGGYSSAVATCPAGTALTGGGEGNSAPGTLLLTDSLPIGQSWLAFVKSNDTISQTFTVYAVCI